MSRGMFKLEKRMVSVMLSIVLSLSFITTGYGEIGPGISKKNETNGVSVYVSKLSKTLTLKQNNVTIGTYPVSIGENSSQGHKQVEGDRRTPSGEYYICTRNDKSVCYLALGLSYPGISDANRGYEEGIITKEERDAIISAVEAGEKPPWDTALGGLIEIHGKRKPEGFTAGCVAVDNDVMDILWEYCQKGVVVTIGP